MFLSMALDFHPDVASLIYSAQCHREPMSCSVLFANRCNRCHSPKLFIRRRCIAAMSSDQKIVWLSTRKKEALTAALESGFGTLLSDSASTSQVEDWRKLGRFETVTAHPDGSLQAPAGEVVGRLCRLRNAADLAAAEAFSAQPGVVVMRNSDEDGHIIPAENLVAAFQAKPATLLAVTHTAAESRVMLTALEAGTDGVVLETDDPAEVRSLAQYLQYLQRQGTEQLQYQSARVAEVRAVGMGDRACIDLAAVMTPGEGLLVGSFARALFLVHSECADSEYINARPFRVNAGPVHAYVQAPGGRTRYLSELRSGDEVVVVDPAGAQRSAVVGRVKIEVLVEAVTDDGQSHSLLLQNAETVRLVGPLQSGGGGGSGAAWRAVSVSELKAGDELFLLRQGGARHTGVSIEESIVER